MNQNDPQQFFSNFVDSVESGWQDWAEAFGYAAVAAVVGLIVHFIVLGVMKRVFKRLKLGVAQKIWKQLEKPSALLFMLLGVKVVLPRLLLAPGALALINHLMTILLIVSVMWLLIAMVNVMEAAILSRYRIDVSDNLRARHLHTQFRIIGRTLDIVILVIGAAAILMTFPMVRQLGTSLLASAGIAGLAIGLAARPMLENLIAGLQLAAAQPISLDDVVIIEGEWGRIEEITATYVVVRIWDQRRLIVPFSHILSRPFQNWTRKNSEILGTVFLHTDYTVPVDRVRGELQKITEASEKWDGRVCGLQVTDSKAETLELRALVSAEDASKAWDLRCEVRERLVEFLQREYPQCLPRTRAELLPQKT
jgi:small-conductance mechanosensitive channel